MKRIFICLVFLIFTSTVFATVDLSQINFNTVTSGKFDRLLKGWIDTLNNDIVNAGGLWNVGTGRIYFVDSGAGGTANAAGTKPEWAWPTLDDAFDTGRVTTNRGDYVYVLQGHNEAFTAADAADVDIAGVTIVGLGNGTLAPTFDYDGVAGELVVGADDVFLINLRFRASTNTVLKAIDIQTTTANTSIINCEFIIEDITDEFVDTIQCISTTNTKIIACTFDAGEATAATAIQLRYRNLDTVIRDNFVHGDYSIANINGIGTLSQDLLIEQNILWNGVTSGLNAQPVIELLTGTVGIITGNKMACNVATAGKAIESDSTFQFENWYNESAGGSTAAWQLGVSIRSTTAVTVTTGSD